jgi:hypothetical protein
VRALVTVVTGIVAGAEENEIQIRHLYGHE